MDNEIGYLFNINDHSLEEKVIGKFVDGKPKYRKTIVFENFTYNRWVNFGISNIDWIIDVKGMFLEGSNFVPLVSIYQENNTFSPIDSRHIYKLNRTSFYIATKSNPNTTDKLILTLEYTKTTD